MNNIECRPAEITFLIKQLRKHQASRKELAARLSSLTDELIAAHFEIKRLREESKSNSEQSSQSSTYLYPEHSRKLKLLILGASQIKEKEIYGIAKTYGLNKENLTLCLDYKKNKRFDLEELRWNSGFGGILVGPIAHKTVGLGDHHSLLKALKQEGFPPHCGIWNTVGELKITKASFRASLECMLSNLEGTTARPRNRAYYH